MTHRFSLQAIRTGWLPFGIGIILSISGCETFQNSTLSIPSIPLTKEIVLSNPMNVNSADTEFVWNQIVDAVDNYFRIRSEERPARDAYWKQGLLETYPEIGATYLEPWRKDALEGYQRLQSTFQTMRRTARIRVTPVDQGFTIAVEVIKEIEDVDRSLYSSEGSAAVRHDDSVVRTDRQLTANPITLGWIRQENDTDLEQRILREILGRVSNVRPPRTRWVDYLK